MQPTGDQICSTMNASQVETSSARDDTELSRGLAALSAVTFNYFNPAQILDLAEDTVAALSPCRVEASYRSVNGQMVAAAPPLRSHSELETSLINRGWDGRVEVRDRSWGWAFALRYEDTVNGCLVLSAAERPNRTQILLLTVLAQQAGAALACAEMHHRDMDRARELEKTTGRLATVVESLQGRASVHQTLEVALRAGSGEHGIADAIYRLTGLAVCIEDRFGNLRHWVGDGRPDPYPKASTENREDLLRRLSASGGSMRVGDRVVMLVKPRADVLAVLSLVDPGSRATEDNVFALRYASTVLGLELAHQRNLAEMELTLRRELVDDLLAGTNEDGAYMRAEALGHDLRGPHYVIVVTTAGGGDSTLACAAGHAATSLHLSYLQGRQSGMVVLVADGRPEPRRLHRALSRQLGNSTSVIGIGPRCDIPSDIPQSFAKARRAMNLRLHSAAPAGASAYDELGFYRLVDAAHTAGAVEDFIGEWLGRLLDYDNTRNAELVNTLSTYLECGGNYDKSAAALHIHRSTLRYRLGRIGELAGYDLRNVDTRFNLHAATRARRFLNPDS
jgi:hypothetical protein